MNSPVIAFKLTDVGSDMSIGGLDSTAYYNILSSSNVAVQGYWSFLSARSLSTHITQSGPGLRSLILYNYFILSFFLN